MWPCQTCCSTIHSIEPWTSNIDWIGATSSVLAPASSPVKTVGKPMEVPGWTGIRNIDDVTTETTIYQTTDSTGTQGIARPTRRRIREIFLLNPKFELVCRSLRDCTPARKDVIKLLTSILTWSLSSSSNRLTGRRVIEFRFSGTWPLHLAFRQPLYGLYFIPYADLETLASGAQNKTQFLGR